MPLPPAIFELLPLQIRASIDDPQIIVPFVATGVTGEGDIVNWVDSFVATERQGLHFNSWTGQYTSDDIFEGELVYGIRQDKRTGESSFRFDTSGGTQKITQALEHIASYSGTNFVPEFHGAINVNGDRVEGCDVAVPVYTWEETHYIDEDLITEAYKRTLFELTATVNDAPFKGFAKGESLFLGASGSKRGADNWEITFKGVGSKNVQDLEIAAETTDGGPLIVEEKEGWHYLWHVFEEAEDTTAKHLIKRARFSYVERVYEYGNHALLGIGT